MLRLLRQKKLRDALVGLALLVATAGLVAAPSEAIAGAKDGLTLCFNVIVPSLFPFFVLSSLVVDLGLAAYLGRAMEGLMRPLFRVSGSCATAVALGFVGGYADRHIQGKTTILFMRKVKKPDEPWLTIEMDGSKLVQIHGFKNEGLYSAKGRFAPDPREVYREFLDIWLDWIEKGSRHDKKGNPKLPKKKGAAA